MFLNKVKSTLSKRYTQAILIIIATCISCAAAGVPKSFGPDGWLVLGVIGVLFVSLMYNLVPTDQALLLSLAILMLFQTMSTSDALKGFSSSSVLAVAALYPIAAGISSTGSLDYILNKILGTPSSLFSAQLRLIIPTCIISAFMNNTPVVAILIPIVQNWSAKAGFPVSQLMIPLSFAAILGGTCTLIGTSTNLVVAAKAKEVLNVNLGLFDLGTVGVPVMITGTIYILLFSKYLLPDAETLKLRRSKQLGEDSESESKGRMNESGKQTPNVVNSLMVSCIVNPTSSVVNSTVKSKLRNLDGLYLTSVIRNSELLQAVGPEFVINENDILQFSGIVDNFPDFCLRYDFTPLTSENEDLLLSSFMDGSLSGSPKSNSPKIIAESALPIKDVAPVEIFSGKEEGNKALQSNLSREVSFRAHVKRVVVKSDGKLDGKTPKEVNFRKTYHAAILTVYRAGTKLDLAGNLGRYEIKSGDLLVILAGEDFSWQNDDTRRDLSLARSEDLESETEPIPSQFVREYLISMKVADSSRLIGTKSLVGQTIESAGLRGLPGLFLIALERGTDIKYAVGSDEILVKDDILWFAGERNSVSTLRRIPGLVSPISDQVAKLNIKKVQRRLVECVISPRSQMLGQTIKQAKFRTKFRAAVIAVHRQGHRVLKKVGDIELKAGDVLILDTGPYFIQRFRDDRNFLLVAEIENSETPQFAKFYIALICIIGMMALYTAFQNSDEYEISLFECAIVASAVMIFCSIITPERARDSVNWDVIISVACAFGLSTALENTKVAETIGTSVVKLADITHTGEAGVLTTIYLATFGLSIILANNAAALLMFPIALQAITKDGVLDTRMLNKILYTLMFAASSSFASPFGYQTNLMVYGPGHYVFTDFIKFGLPLQFWQMIFSVAFVYFIDFWYVSWVVTISIFIALTLGHYFLIKSEGLGCAKTFLQAAKTDPL